MSGLLYRPDMDEVRKRLTTWWAGGDIGRPALNIVFDGPVERENIPALSQPAGWTTDYSVKDYNYRINIAARRNLKVIFMGEAVPHATAELGPSTLALFLGGKAIEGDGTVWFEPVIDDPDKAKFEFDPENFYWKFVLKMSKDLLKMGKGKFLVAFPDLIEGLDILASLRGTEKLLFDLIERPEWVHECMEQITTRYFEYYDILYNMYKDETGGTNMWAWGPGRTAKLQCDFSAMISPDMFAEFMVPVLKKMTEKLDTSIYHWDGPPALPHHDNLLSIPKLSMLQWTPGAGVEPGYHKRWWPIYHKTVDAGKKLMVNQCDTIDDLKAMKKEFGPKLKQFLITFWPKNMKEAEEVIKVASF